MTDIFANVRGRPPQRRPFPFAPFWALADQPNYNRLCDELRISSWTLAIARDEGLTVEQADRWAIAIGRHPAEVWGWDWYADALEHEEAA